MCLLCTCLVRLLHTCGYLTLPAFPAALTCTWSALLCGSWRLLACDFLVHTAGCSLDSEGHATGETGYQPYRSGDCPAVRDRLSAISELCGALRRKAMSGESRSPSIRSLVLTGREPTVLYDADEVLAQMQDQLTGGDGSENRPTRRRRRSRSSSIPAAQPDVSFPFSRTSSRVATTVRDSPSGMLSDHAVHAGDHVERKLIESLQRVLRCEEKE